MKIFIFPNLYDFLYFVEQIFKSILHKQMLLYLADILLYNYASVMIIHIPRCYLYYDTEY